MIICWSTKNKVAISSNFVFGISYDVEVGVCERDSLCGTSIIMPPQYLYAATNLHQFNMNGETLGGFLVALLIFCHQTRTNVVLVGILLHFHFLL